VSLATSSRRELLTAVAFLTRLPVGTRFGIELGGRTTGAAAFGLVGAVIGALAAVPVLVLGERATLAGGALAVAVLAITSGALHLDGLADTADALAAPTRDAATRARRDPRVGAAGAAAIAVAVVVDAALLAALAGTAGAAVAAVTCVVAAAGSRVEAPVVAWLERRRRLRAPAASQASAASSPGLGAWFVAGSTDVGTVVGVASMAFVALAGAIAMARAALVLGWLLGAAGGLALAAWLVRARGALDGDGFGFIVETTFTSILLATVILL
jgi:adenosylcobinamide-GDP ribazoletransferase